MGVRNLVLKLKKNAKFVDDVLATAAKLGATTVNRQKATQDHKQLDFTRARGRRARMLVVALAVLASPMLVGTSQATVDSGGADVAVVVRELPDAGNGP